MKPQYLNDIAFVIGKIQDISSESPGKKKLQKLVYLIEKKGIDLGCGYGLHFYGPYSAALDAMTADLSDDGIISFDYSGLSHRMSLINAEAAKISSPKRENAVTSVLTRYKDWTPSRLELLTTAIYAYENLEEKTLDSVINGVKKIKGSKYSQDEIVRVIQEFEFFDLAI